jgi:hypothetical protein
VKRTGTTGPCAKGCMGLGIIPENGEMPDRALCKLTTNILCIWTMPAPLLEWSDLIVLGAEHAGGDRGQCH